MNNSPRYVGFIEPPYIKTFTDQSSGVPLDLTGCVSANFTLTMLNTGTKQARQGTGVWTTLNQTTNKGQASYQWTLADVASAGPWEIYTTIKLPAETSPREMDPEFLEFLSGTVGAGAAPPGVLPNPAQSLPFLNIRDFGGIGDGITDCTTAISDARAAARALGGARICYGPGRFRFRNQDTSNDHGVYHDGSGKGTTILELMDDANEDLFSGQTNLINLSASFGSGPTGTLYDFGFSNMTIDGNKANQSGSSYGLRFYGFTYIMENLEVRNCLNEGILSDWSGFNNYDPGDSMIAFWNNVKVHNCGGRGVAFGGPHDSKFVNCEFYCNGSHNLHIAPNGGSVFTNLHTWFNQNLVSPQTTYQSDTFTRADQSGLGTASNGEAYTVTQLFPTMTAAISGNKAVFSGTSTEAVYILGSDTHTDGEWSLQETLGGDATSGVALLWHYQNSNNLYKFSIYNGVAFVQKTVAGSDTTLTSFTPSFTIDPTLSQIHLKVRQAGTTIKAKAWLDGTIEPPWIVTTTDSTYASGTSGFMAYNDGAFTPTVRSFTVQSVPTQSSAISTLVEGDHCQFNNCVVETSDTVHLVVLGNYCIYNGGALYDALSPSFASAVKIGQQAGETPYPGQIKQSGGVTTAVAPIGCRFDTLIKNCGGDNGALWLDNDGGDNVFDLTIELWLKGVNYTGTLQSSTNYREVYNDGARLSPANTYYRGNLHLTGQLQVQSAATLYSGSGIPSNSIGFDGDFYLRIDTPGTANQRLYVKSAGAWIGIL